MYAHCLFCHTGFGANREIEHLPIGRRMAFDADHGRLWIVCRACRRWNLTPFDERWEAIEECDRRFGDTSVRTSTDHIGLARLPDGLELIRIGRPLRPEFAAWRYGSRFLRRHHLRRLPLAGQAGLVALGPALAAAFGPIAPLTLSLAAGVAAVSLSRRSAVAVTCEAGERLDLSLGQIHTAMLIRDDGHPDGWGLVVDHLSSGALIASITTRRFEEGPVLLSGRDARLVAALVLPRLNPLGGSVDGVSDAVRWLESAGGPDSAFRAFARRPGVRPALAAHQSTFASMHPGVRLALEMALHEDEERRLLSRELSALELAWRHEERRAAIADGLALPAWLEGAMARIRRRADGEGDAWRTGDQGDPPGTLLANGGPT